MALLWVATPKAAKMGKNEVTQNCPKSPKFDQNCLV